MKTKIVIRDISLLISAILVCTSCAFAAEKKVAVDESLVKAADELALHSQSLVKNYFYVHQELNTTMATADIKRYTESMAKNFAIVSKAANTEKLQSLTRFMSMTLNDLNDVIDEPYSEDNAFIALDMSDVILEGATNIRNALTNNTSLENNLIHILEYQRFLIERLTKLYISAHMGFRDFNTLKQVEIAVREFDDGMAKIENYEKAHTPEMSTYVEKLRERWEAAKGFYVDINESQLPQTVFYSTEVMERYLKKLLNNELEGGK